jgi:hypothetical protein
LQKGKIRGINNSIIKISNQPGAAFAIILATMRGKTSQKQSSPIRIDDYLAEIFVKKIKIQVGSAILNK